MITKLTINKKIQCFLGVNQETVLLYFYEQVIIIEKSYLLENEKVGRRSKAEKICIAAATNNILCPFQPTICPSSESHNSRADWARELFKSTKDAKVLQIRSKKFAKFCLLEFCGWRHEKVGISIFGPLHRAMDPNPMSQLFDARFCWNLDYNTSVQSPWLALSWLVFASKVMV